MAPGPGWRVSAYVSGGNDDPAGFLTPAEEQAEGDDDEGEGEESKAAVDLVLKKYKNAEVMDDDEGGGFDARY